MKNVLFSEQKSIELFSHPKENLAFKGSAAPSIHFNLFAAPGASHGSLGIFIITFISSSPSPACIFSSNTLVLSQHPFPMPPASPHPAIIHPIHLRGASSLLPSERAVNILPSVRSLAHQAPAQTFQHFIYNRRCLNCLG